MSFSKCLKPAPVQKKLMLAPLRTNSDQAQRSWIQLRLKPTFAFFPLSLGAPASATLRRVTEPGVEPESTRIPCM